MEVVLVVEWRGWKPLDLALTWGSLAVALCCASAAEMTVEYIFSSRHSLSLRGHCSFRLHRHSVQLIFPQI